MSTQVQNVKYLNEFNGNRSSTDRGCLLQGIRLRFDRQLLADSVEKVAASPCLRQNCPVSGAGANSMMGQLPGGQQRLFYSFNLEDHVPAQHLLRSIDQCLDLSDLRAYLADFYSPIGRPSIDPELMVRMLVVGYCYGILSKRRS